MKIEFVTHCWQYWRCLTLQLSSFLLHPPSDTSVLVSVCYCPEDTLTQRRMGQIEEWSQATGMPDMVEFRGIAMEKEMLCRRAIGRNQLALTTDADWVWFADCDMVFRGHAIDALAGVLADAGEAKMVYPQTVRATSQASGDKTIFNVDENWAGPVDVELESWGEKRYHAAIGGAQIVRADVCHSEGYLNKYPGYRRPEKVWKRTHEDPLFRRKCIGGRGMPVRDAVVCSGVGRVRHSQRGRFDIGLEM